MLLRKNLVALKAQAYSRIDSAAADVRLLFITASPGQEMVYQQKRAEAEMVLADPEIDPQEVPHIAAEAGLNEMTLAAQAQVILTKADQWKLISAPIETKRLAAKAAVAVAANPAAIEAAAEVDWSDIIALAG